jgi:hypothetical protein
MSDHTRLIATSTSTCLVEAPYPSRTYSWYVVTVLTAICTFSFIDRNIFSLLVGPLRRDLAISDTQVSLL